MSRARIVLAALLVALVVAGIAVATSQKHFRVIAAGDFEVPIRDSPALGRANFYVGQGGETLGYRLSVSKIENVIMAHIHLAPPGANGDIVVWLYPSTAPGPRAPGWRADTGHHRRRRDHRGRPRGPTRRHGDRRPHRGAPERQRVCERAHERRRRPSQHGAGRLPGWRDPRQLRSRERRWGGRRPTFPPTVTWHVVCRPFGLGSRRECRHRIAEVQQ